MNTRAEHSGGGDMGQLIREYPGEDAIGGGSGSLNTEKVERMVRRMHSNGYQSRVCKN